MKIEKIPHTITAGAVNRGKLDAPFLAVSFNNRTGEYLRTYHHVEKLAIKRLRGNSKHSERHYIDRTEVKDKNGKVLPPREYWFD